jgi:hypothetical protein
METEIPEEGDNTLYEELVSLTGIEYSDSEFKNPDAWKEEVARHFNEKYDPDDTVAEEEFSKLSKAVQDWVTDVTLAINANKKKKAKDRDMLPSVSGFPVTEEVVKEKPRRGRPPKVDGAAPKPVKPKSEKVKKEKKVKTASVKGVKTKRAPRDRNIHRPSRYERVMRFMKDNPSVVDPIAIGEATDVSPASIGYCMEAARGAFLIYQPDHPSLNRRSAPRMEEPQKKVDQVVPSVLSVGPVVDEENALSEENLLKDAEEEDYEDEDDELEDDDDDDDLDAEKETV